MLAVQLTYYYKLHALIYFCVHLRYFLRIPARHSLIHGIDTTFDYKCILPLQFIFSDRRWQAGLLLYLLDAEERG